MTISPGPAADDMVVRLGVHVRPRSAATVVGGTHDGALLVRVAEPAHGGRANTAALRALAEALGVPRRSIVLLRGATARRKVIGVRVPLATEASVHRRLSQLQSG